jgi:hypothetical protein
VVLPALLRPSTARTTGRRGVPWPGSRRVIVSTTVLSSSARHGPASGSSGASCRATSLFYPWSLQPVLTHGTSRPGSGSTWLTELAPTCPRAALYGGGPDPASPGRFIHREVKGVGLVQRFTVHSASVPLNPDDGVHWTLAMCTESGTSKETQPTAVSPAGTW